MALSGRLDKSWWIFAEPDGDTSGKLFHAHLQPDDSLVDLITHALKVIPVAAGLAVPGAPAVAAACAFFGVTLALSQNKDTSYDLYSFRIEERLQNGKTQIVAFTGAVSDRRFFPPIGVPGILTPFDMILGFMEGSVQQEHFLGKLQLGARNYGLSMVDMMKLHPLAWPFIPFMKKRHNPLAIGRIAGSFRQEPVPD